MIHPLTFCFTLPSPEDAIKVIIKIVAAAGNELASQTVMASDKRLKINDHVYTGHFDELALGGAKIGYDIPVRLTVQAVSSNDVVSELASSPEFMFTREITPNTPTKVEVEKDKDNPRKAAVLAQVQSQQLPAVKPANQPASTPAIVPLHKPAIEPAKPAPPKAIHPAVDRPVDRPAPAPSHLPKVLHPVPLVSHTPPSIPHREQPANLGVPAKPFVTITPAPARDAVFPPKKAYDPCDPCDEKDKT